MHLVHDEQVVQALGAGRADPALRVGVGVRARGTACARPPRPRPRRPCRRPAGTSRRGRGSGSAARRARLLQRPAEVACLLRHPGGGGMGGAARDMHAPGAELEEEQDVHGLEEQRLDGEEVAGDERAAVPRRKARQVSPRRPRCGAGATWWRLRHVADGGATDGVAQLAPARRGSGCSPSARSRRQAAGPGLRGRRPAAVAPPRATARTSISGARGRGASAAPSRAGTGPGCAGARRALATSPASLVTRTARVSFSQRASRGGRPAFRCRMRS